MKYFCGWDGGGSKTEVLCADEEGRQIACRTLGPLNLNGAPEEKVSETIENAVNFMNSAGALDDCPSLVIGAAGVSNARVRTFLTDEIRRCGYSGRLTIVGDHEIALEGLISGPGAVLIAGTGSVCVGRDESGNRARAGGFGHLIDDGGSGYAIGRDILSAVVRAHDGRGCRTVLTDLTLEYLGASDMTDVTTWLYGPQTKKKDVAALAPLLNHALQENDAAAKEIALTAAKELAQMANAVWNTLGLREGQLALTGSIFEHYIVIRSEVRRLCRELCPEMDVISPQRRASEGAVKLAMKAYLSEQAQP